MFFLRILLLIVICTSIGIGIIFYKDLSSQGKGIYYYTRGNVAWFYGDYEKAENYYLKSSKSKSPRKSAYLKLAEIKLKAEKKDEALKYYEKALELDPTSPDLLDKVAKSELEKDHPHAALALYQKALRLDPDNMEIKAAIGNIYFLMAKKTSNREDYSQAASVFEEFANSKEKKYAENELFHYRLAESFYAQGKYEDALEIYCELAGKHPDNPQTLYSLAVTLAKSDAPDEASKYMIQAAELIDDQRPDLSQKWVRQAFRFKQTYSSGKHSSDKAVTACLSQLQAAEKERSAEK